MYNSYPRLMIAGLGGDSGKTFLSIGLLKSLQRKGKSVTAFKKGPDYIDAAWLHWASGVHARNLDTYMMDGRAILNSFLRHGTSSGLNVIEGNRGLYDGMDMKGTHSSAELAKLLQSPVILVMSVKKVTRTVAALVLGCQKMDPEVNIRGVVLNHVANTRQEKVITKAIESICGIPVVGSIPVIKNRSMLPGRHLGLITPEEHRKIDSLESHCLDAVGKHVDIGMLEKIAESSPTLDKEKILQEQPSVNISDPPVTIGIFQDSAFTFYYPENLESLVDAGAILQKISPLYDKEISDDIDALYIGGGFPETHAHLLSQNKSMLRSVKKRTVEGLPVYAECGGLIYLAQNLRWNGVEFPMCGAIPITVQMESKPQGHGYCNLRVVKKNLYFPINRKLTGHEFHYSRIIRGVEKLDFAFQLKKGTGSHHKKDGLMYNNILASYVHLHALGVPEWGKSMVGAARQFQECLICRKLDMNPHLPKSIPAG